MANIFKRINDLINANINDLIDKVEDPQRMIKQIIREMEENIRQAKEGVIIAIANDKRLQHELEHNRQQSEQWYKKAELAIKNNDDELARAALKQKKEYETIIQRIEPMWSAAVDSSDGLKQQLQQLENKLQDLKRKKNSLVSRQRAVETQMLMQESDFELDHQLENNDKFQRMEEKILDMEVRTQARVEIEGHFNNEKSYNEMRIESEVDAEMEAMKKQLQ